MKSLAAVNMLQFERAVESLEQYKAVVDTGWTVLLRYGEPMPLKTRSKIAVCMIIGSDQGMCGQFNEVLLPFAEEQIRALNDQRLDMTYWSLGEKINGALQDAGLVGGEQFSVPGSLNAVNARVQEVIQRIENRRSDKNLEHVYLCYNRVSDRGGYTQVFEKVLPLDKSWAEAYTSQKWPNRCLPMMGLPKEAMFRHLFRQHLFISFYRALAQSLAGENAARLMAMQAAEKNILELEEGLQALFREQRQAGITSELMDIISGFEALNKEDVSI
jgi:F-type H+-transporting ATPase subunit gamma